MGPNKVEARDVPDPTVRNRRGAIVRVTSTAICGSDLHLLDGYVPSMESGDVMGHEFMGEVIEVGPGVDSSKLKVGDRVVVPFPIACGACAQCKRGLFSTCENSNPNAGIAEKLFGHPTAGIFGYSHLTGGFGPDKCIDAVGLEATHGSAHVNIYDRVKQATRMETERPHALRQAILSCRSGGIVSVVGVYGGMLDKFPAGAWMNRALTLKTGQAHVHRYMRPLLERIEKGELDPTRIITHRVSLSDAPQAYETFKNKQDNCEKVVLTP